MDARRLKLSIVARLAPLCALTSCGHDSREPAQRDAEAGVDAPVFKQFWTSGTRFRARLWKAVDGGEPVFGGWRDTQLDTDCESAMASDRVERCMPLHAQVDPARYHSDPLCSEPLAWAPTSPCGHDNYAVTSAPPYSAFRITGVYTGPVYFGSAGGGRACSPRAKPGCITPCPRSQSRRRCSRRRNTPRSRSATSSISSPGLATAACSISGHSRSRRVPAGHSEEFATGRPCAYPRPPRLHRRRRSTRTRPARSVRSPSPSPAAFRRRPAPPSSWSSLHLCAAPSSRCSTTRARS